MAVFVILKSFTNKPAFDTKRRQIKLDVERTSGPTAQNNFMRFSRQHELVLGMQSITKIVSLQTG